MGLTHERENLMPRRCAGGGNCTRGPCFASPCGPMPLRHGGVLLAGNWLGTTGVKRHLRAPHDTTSGVAPGYRGVALSPPSYCQGRHGAGGIRFGSADVARQTRCLRLRVQSVTSDTDGTHLTPTGPPHPALDPGNLLGRFRALASRPTADWGCFGSAEYCGSLALDRGQGPRRQSSGRRDSAGCPGV